MVFINGLNPVIVLLSVGLIYIISGGYFKVPVPVQPLKAMAAVAIATTLNAGVINAAGILIGFILLFLNISKLNNLLKKLFKPPFIKGIQLGIGLMLLKTSWGLVLKPIAVNNDSVLFFIENFISLRQLVISVGIVLMLLFFWNNRFPVTAGVLAFGIIISILGGQYKLPALLQLPLKTFSIHIPAYSDFIKAFFYW